MVPEDNDTGWVWFGFVAFIFLMFIALIGKCDPAGEYPCWYRGMANPPEYSTDCPNPNERK